MGRVGEDGSGFQFVIDLVAQDVFVIIPLPDVGGAQFPPGAAGDGGLKRANDGG